MYRFLFSLFFFIPVLSFSQSNYIKGYVVTNSKDTLKGYINYKEHIVNPVSVTFKSDLNSKPQTFTVGNCAAVAIGDMVSYQRFIVTISMGEVNASSLSSGPDSTSRQDTVLLRILQTGKNVTLFSYADHLKTRFYVKDKNDETPYELIRQVFFDREKTGVIVTNDKYRRQLLAVMRKFNLSSESMERKLSTLAYGESDMIRIASIINGQETVKSKYAKTRFFAGLGINRNLTKYVGQSLLAGANATNKVSYAPFLTAGVDLFANPAIGKLIYRLELSLLTSKSEISVPRPNDNGYSENVSFTQYSAIVSPQLIYNIYNTDPLKVFIGGGAGMHFSGYGKKQFSMTNFYGQVMPMESEELRLLSFSIPFSAGVVLHKRIALSAKYTVPFSISDGGSYNVQVQRFSAGINYLFGKH